MLRVLWTAGHTPGWVGGLCLGTAFSALRGCTVTSRDLRPGEFSEGLKFRTRAANWLGDQDITHLRFLARLFQYALNLCAWLPLPHEPSQNCHGYGWA